MLFVSILDTKCGVERDGLFIVLKTEVFCRELDGVSRLIGDVSFISLTKVLGPVKSLLTDEGQVVCLIKPQFEAGREKVGKKGVVRDKKVHLEVIRMVMEFAAGLGFELLNLEYSPIRGPEGNIEYLLYLQNRPDGAETVGNLIDPAAVVEQSHENL